MAIDKILGKIHQHINELTPSLELFVDESIQPSVADCEALQEKFAELLECVAVYKHYKAERELSPSFNIHARVSEKKVREAEKKQVDDAALPESTPAGQAHEHVTKTYPAMSVAINDKFRFINELFKQSTGEYNIAIEQINSLHAWQDAELYLNSLKMIYNWKDNSEIVQHLYSLVKKRFTE